MCCRSVLKGRSLLSDTGRLALRRPGAAGAHLPIYPSLHWAKIGCGYFCLYFSVPAPSAGMCRRQSRPRPRCLSSLPNCRRTAWQMPRDGILPGPEWMPWLFLAFHFGCSARRQNDGTRLSTLVSPLPSSPLPHRFGRQPPPLTTVSAGRIVFAQWTSDLA